MNLFRENQNKPKAIYLQSGCNPSFPPFFIYSKLTFIQNYGFEPCPKNDIHSTFQYQKHISFFAKT